MTDVRKFGLPPGLSHRRLFAIESGEQAGDWQLYVENVSGLRVAIAESTDGGALWCRAAVVSALYTALAADKQVKLYLATTCSPWGSPVITGMDIVN